MVRYRASHTGGCNQSYAPTTSCPALANTAFQSAPPYHRCFRCCLVPNDQGPTLIHPFPAQLKPSFQCVWLLVPPDPRSPPQPPAFKFRAVFIIRDRRKLQASIDQSVTIHLPSKVRSELVSNWFSQSPLGNLLSRISYEVLMFKPSLRYDFPLTPPPARKQPLDHSGTRGNDWTSRTVKTAASAKARADSGNPVDIFRFGLPPECECTLAGQRGNERPLTHGAGSTPSFYSQGTLSALVRCVVTPATVPPPPPFFPIGQFL